MGQNFMGYCTPRQYRKLSCLYEKEAQCRQFGPDTLVTAARPTDNTPICGGLGMEDRLIYSS